MSCNGSNSSSGRVKIVVTVVIVTIDRAIDGQRHTVSTPMYPQRTKSRIQVYV